MVEEVNKIIYNMLIGGKEVLLPEVGTLYIERQAAKRISKNRLLSPCNAVNFSSQETGRSIVDEIVAIANCDEAQARDIYDRWLAKTREGNRITISGVGVLNDKSFSPEPEFNAAINPDGVKTLEVRHRSNTWLYVVCGVCVLLAICVGAYMMWGDSLLSGVGVVKSEKTETVVAEPDSTQVAQPIASDSLAAAAAAQAAEAKASVAAIPDDYKFWVVVGVYSTEQNAARALRQSRLFISNADERIIPFKNKFIAAVYGSNKRSDCVTFSRSYADPYPDMWIYEIK